MCNVSNTRPAPLPRPSLFQQFRGALQFEEERDVCIAVSLSLSRSHTSQFHSVSAIYSSLACPLNVFTAMPLRLTLFLLRAPSPLSPGLFYYFIFHSNTLFLSFSHTHTSPAQWQLVSSSLPTTDSITSVIVLSRKPAASGSSGAGQLNHALIDINACTCKTYPYVSQVIHNLAAHSLSHCPPSSAVSA